MIEVRVQRIELCVATCDAALRPLAPIYSKRPLALRSSRWPSAWESGGRFRQVVA